jgi:poly-beta-1,6-N-acetyl-D-glucosamine synthase
VSSVLSVHERARITRAVLPHHLRPTTPAPVAPWREQPLGPRTGRVVVLLPAHNEEVTLTATLASLAAQTRLPDRVVVVADNCTDNTALLAYAAGVEVFVTVDNTAKKAGALNQGLDHVLRSLGDTDHLLLVDADSMLCADWIEQALAALDRDAGTGAVSGAYVARKGRGLVTLLQRAEYAQERRRVARRGGHVDVLSGTAVLVPVPVLRALIGERGYAYDESSLTEDFEITLAIKALGYQPRCYKDLHVVTDVMETWGDLARQRIRWQRGTIETLRSYGWSPLTRRLWRAQALAYASTFVTALVLAAWGGTIMLGATPDLRWLLLLPVYAVEQVVTTRRAGWAPALVAGLLVPMWAYDLFRVSIYWIALSRSLRRTDAAWA